MNIIRKGLTGFDLKYLALIFMVLDHIHYFFEFTGKVPIWFSWLGRLVANLNEHWKEQQEQKLQIYFWKMKAMQKRLNQSRRLLIMQNELLVVFWRY
jgi:hypothetical protein